MKLKRDTSVNFVTTFSPGLLRGICVAFAICSLGSCLSHKAIAGPPVLEGNLSLILNIDGLVCCDGILRVGVYHDKTYWLKDDGMVRGRIGMVVSAQQRIEIHGLPAGRYAVAVHQDINGDRKFNRRFGFLPKEPYGFSNNVGKYGPASFRAAAIELERDREISITLNQLRGSRVKKHNESVVDR